MYKSIYDSYNLQREELLARIAQKLELNETRKKEWNLLMKQYLAY